jgi:hypothetical protein
MRRFSLLVIADGSESTLSFTLDENWSHVFEGEQIEFGDSLHIAVLSKVSGGSYRFVGFDRTGLNLPIRSIISEDIVVKIDSLPHWERRRMSIPTAIGEFTLEFALHCRLAFWTEWAHLPDDQL